MLKERIRASDIRVEHVSVLPRLALISESNVERP